MCLEDCLVACCTCGFLAPGMFGGLILCSHCSFICLKTTTSDVLPLLCLPSQTCGRAAISGWYGLSDGSKIDCMHVLFHNRKCV